jgi:2-succinyl-6-hydroxy-2,4-cyclohexadiene-1-carboxylate synthase
MDRIEVNHYRFHYEAVGSPSNPPILFLHGFMGDLTEFHEAIARLSQQYYCLAIDLPGHGNTEVKGGDRCYEMAFTADGLVQFLEAINIQQCFLVGYSMGGRLALYLTLHFPKYFAKAILESASPGLKTESERVVRLESDRKLAQKLEASETSDLFSFLNTWYSQPLFASLKSHPNFDLILTRRLSNTPLGLAKSLYGLGVGQQPSLWEELGNNQVPLLLLAGELDPKYVALNREMLDLSNSHPHQKLACLEIVSNCGHNIHFENSDIFVKKVTGFLSST